MRKKSKEDEQTLEQLNSPHCRSQEKCQLIQTSYINQIKLFLFSPYKKHLINRATVSRSVWVNLDLGRLHRPTGTYDLGQDSPIQTSCLVKYMSWLGLYLLDLLTCFEFSSMSAHSSQSCL